MFNDVVASHTDGFHDVLQHIVDVTLDYFVDDTLVNAHCFFFPAAFTSGLILLLSVWLFLCCLSNMF